MKKKNKAPEESETVTVTMSRETAVEVKLACEEYIRFRMGQFEDFVNEVCCWDYTEQMEKECHTSEERKKFHREHEQDFRKCMRLRNHMREGRHIMGTKCAAHIYSIYIAGGIPGGICMACDPLCAGVA